MLHPQARAVLAKEAGSPPASDPARDVDAIRAEIRAETRAEPREDVFSVADVDADGVPVRVYVPVGGVEALPTIVHLHGGGFVFNDLDTHDAVCRRLANRSGMAVVSVDYRRPPEDRFPAAPDDVDAALGWLVRDGASYRLDASALFGHGDSAGANLALVAALRNPGLFRAVALIYPFIDASMSCVSYGDPAGAWNRDEAAWCWEQYASSPEDYANPDFSPFASDRLDTLPPTLVVTSEHDVLRDEGEQLAARIAETGVPCVGVRYLGMVHGFWRNPAAYDAAEPLMRQVAGFFRQYA